MNKNIKKLLYSTVFLSCCIILLNLINIVQLEYKKYLYNKGYTVNYNLISSNENIGTKTYNLTKTEKVSNNKEKSKKELEQENIDRQNYDLLFKFVLERVKATYVENKSVKDLYENAINGMLSSLDPHSAYLTEKDFKEMEVQTKGEFAGLGIEITKEFSMIKIISPIEGTPAQKVGLKAGDYISHINDKPVFEMTLNDAVNIMRGKVGEKVKITVLRPGESKPIDYTIKREIVAVKAARGDVKNGIIYLKINSFTEKAYSDSVALIKDMEEKIGKNNVKGLILDLRNNPGGLLDQSIKISELFLDSGKKIVSIKGKDDFVIQEYRSANKKPLFKGKPIIVLVNEGSASASEIVSGALKDNKRALILGTKTFGKGTVQNVMPVPMGGAIKMTIARYYTPNDISIQAKGIEPDIIVEDNKFNMVKQEENKFKVSENDLKGHLENKDNNDALSKQIKQNIELNKKNNIVNSELYEKDFQLARAIDLILGLNAFSGLK